jgi:hypothetical protein
MEREYRESLPGASNSAALDSNRCWGLSSVYPSFAGPQSLPSQRAVSSQSSSPCGFYPRSIAEQMRYTPGPVHAPRRPFTQSHRSGSLVPVQSSPSPWGELGPGPSSEQTLKSPASPMKRPPSAFQQVGLYSMSTYIPQPIGSPLSPTATEFTGPITSDSPWGNSVGIMPLTLLCEPNDLT